MLSLFLFLPSTSLAQTPSEPASVEVDRETIVENETLLVSVMIVADERPRVRVPDWGDFNLVRSRVSDRMVSIDGTFSREYLYHYWVQPVQTGQLTIDSFEVIVDGQTINLHPITINVLSRADAANGGSQPLSGPSQQDDGSNSSANRDFVVEVEVDKPNPYLGEQVIYTHYLYTPFRSGGANYDYPRFTGFWFEEVDEDTMVTNRSGMLDGRRYNVRETKVIIFPTRTGSLQIDETIVTSRSSLSTGSFRLISDPLDIEVKPLPSGAPDDFNGAVGLFTLEAEISNNQAKVDEPITLLVTLEGQGNISVAPDPIWPEMPEWRAFDAQATTFTDFRVGKLFGRRVYERLMVPGIAGNFTIPPITFTYFDPDAEEYRTASSDPIKVQVVPGSGEAPPPVVIGANKEEIERIGADIRHIKPPPTTLTQPPIPLTTQSQYWFAWTLPILLLVLNYGWSRRRAYFQRNIGLTRSLQARKQAKQAIFKARRGREDLYIATGQVLTTYLANKFNQPVAGLTQDRLADLLKSQKIDPALISRVQLALTESDMGRFGPGSSTPNHAEKLLDRTEALIADLEKAFNAL